MLRRNFLRSVLAVGAGAVILPKLPKVIEPEEAEDLLDLAASTLPELPQPPHLPILARSQLKMWFGGSGRGRRYDGMPNYTAYRGVGTFSKDWTFRDGVLACNDVVPTGSVMSGSDVLIQDANAPWSFIIVPTKEMVFYTDGQVLFLDHSRRAKLDKEIKDVQADRDLFEKKWRERNNLTDVRLRKYRKVMAEKQNRFSHKQRTHMLGLDEYVEAPRSANWRRMQVQIVQMQNELNKHKPVLAIKPEHVLTPDMAEETMPKAIARDRQYNSPEARNRYLRARMADDMSFRRRYAEWLNVPEDQVWNLLRA